MSNKKIVVIGGGTVAHISSHLALSAPAYGATARKISELTTTMLPNLDTVVHLTKMAGGDKLETSEDVANLVASLIKDLSVKILFFNPAMVDFKPELIINGHSMMTGKYVNRLDSSKEYDIHLTAYNKVVDSIRKQRKDITLVSFKTTCGLNEDQQYIAGLRLLKRSSSNLVLANDVKTRVNMIITPEEARYHVTTNREEALYNLVEMTGLRSHLTFTRSTVIKGDRVGWDHPAVPATLRQVVEWCIANKAYKPNDLNGATVGHFAVKLDDNTFLTSIRKTNFNDIKNNGLVMVKTSGPDSVIAYGSKPSVGGQSQRIVFSEHDGFNSIVHFHCPIKEGSLVPRVSQREYECGSHECGKNTSSGIKYFTLRNGYGAEIKIGAVYLDNHGPNILFDSYNVDSRTICKFIAENFDLSAKTGGYVSMEEINAANNEE